MFSFFKKKYEEIQESTKSDLELFLEKVLTEETIKNAKITHRTISGYDYDYAVTFKISLKHKNDRIKIELDYNSFRNSYSSIIIDVNNTLSVFYVMSYIDGFDGAVEKLNDSFDVHSIAKEYRNKRNAYYNSKEYKAKKEKEEKRFKEQDQKRQEIINKKLAA